MNKYAIELVESKQLFYKPIYNLIPIKLEILKTYIRIYLKAKFIYTSKSHIDALIFFEQKPVRKFCI